MKIFFPKVLIKCRTILYISITDCHSIKIFFLKGDASGKQTELISVAIETFKMIKLLFLTTQFVKLH